MELIHKVLAPLASLEVQKRYIINGSADEYILPEDLINSAVNLFFEQQALKFEETDQLAGQKKAIRNCTIPDGLTSEELVLNHEPWKRLRNAAHKYIIETGFDLKEWEKNELAGLPQPQSKQEKKPFFVLYKYGMGGIWMIIKASSTEEIDTKYPQLSAYETRPDWMSKHSIANDFHNFRKKGLYFDIDDPPKGILLSCSKEATGIIRINRILRIVIPVFLAILAAGIIFLVLKLVF